MALDAIKEDKTLGGHITDTLRDAIVTGEIKPGSKISEPRLAREYNVSRGPLREAIRRLESMNLVTHIPHEGARVITLDLPRVLEVYHVREALEGKAAALAARNMSSEQISHLNRVLDHARNYMKTHPGKYYQAEGDFDFHYQIIQGSGNRVLIHQLCEELYHLIRMFRYQASHEVTRSSLALSEHEHLVYAIEQHDEQLAETIMRHHIVRARKNIETRLRP
jgi:DNA-binding GntR family transcriptional regulator